jgi:hypothetical protein
MRTAYSVRAVVLAISICMLAACEDSLAGHDGGASSASECDVKAPTACTDPNIRYADVEPIIEKRCLSCHDGSTEQWPLTDYSHVADWYVEVRSMMLTCSMPPPDAGLSMPTAEREKLLLWIRCGYKE